MRFFRRKKKMAEPDLPQEATTKASATRKKWFRLPRWNRQRKIRFKIPFLNRLDVYLMKKFLGTYFFSIILIISVAVVFDYNDNIDKFTKFQAPWDQIIFVYYLNFIPFYVNLFSSLFIFLSVIFFTTKLAGNSEIIAMQAAGVKFSRIMRPYMISAAIIAALSFHLGSEVIPKGSVKRLAFENQYKNKTKDPTYADNIQMQVDTGVIAYIEHYENSNKTGYNFCLDKFYNKKLVSHLTASRITYDTLNAEKYHWIIYRPTIRELKTNTEKIKTTYANVDSVIIMEPSDFMVTKHMEETMTNEELLDQIEKQRIRGTGQTSRFEIEYYKRFASPFASFILATIGLSLSSKKRKNGMGLALGIGLGLSAAYILFQSISSSFSVNAGMHPILAAWLPNIVFTFIAAYLYRKAPK